MNSVIVIGCIGLIAWSFIWSHKRRARKAREKFKRELQGYRFGSWEELKAHWHGRLEFDLDGDFNALRHGSLLETLRVIDEQAIAEWKRWNS